LIDFDVLMLSQLIDFSHRDLNCDSPPSRTTIFSITIYIFAHGLHKPLLLHEPNKNK